LLICENVKIYDHNYRFREDKPIKEQGFKNVLSILEIIVGLVAALLS